MELHYGGTHIFRGRVGVAGGSLWCVVYKKWYIVSGSMLEWMTMLEGALK